jgi:hypothetical protein
MGLGAIPLMLANPWLINKVNEMNKAIIKTWAFIPEKFLEQYLSEGWVIEKKCIWLNARFTSGKPTTEYVMRKV